MIISKALKKELNDGLFLRREVILIYPGCVEVLAPITIESELPFLSLPKRSHA